MMYRLYNREGFGNLIKVFRYISMVEGEWERNCKIRIWEEAEEQRCEEEKTSVWDNETMVREKEEGEEDKGKATIVIMEKAILQVATKTL